MKSKKVVTAALAALALAVGWAAARAQAPLAGRVAKTVGKPQVVRQGQESALKRGDSLYEGDTIKTGASDKIELLFVGGADTRLNSNSEFRIDAAADPSKPTSLFSKLGQAWTNLVHSNAPVAPVEFHSPVAVCAVRGTQADVNVGDQNMAVKVYEGHVELSNEQGKQALVAGQASQVAFHQAPQAPRTMAPSEFGTWQNSVAAKNIQAQQQALLKAAAQERVLELKTKDGKDVKLHLQQKQ